jgi:hypothetical protein
MTEIAVPSYINLSGRAATDRAAGRHFHGTNTLTGERGYWFAPDLALLARRERDGRAAVAMPVRTLDEVRAL